MAWYWLREILKIGKPRSRWTKFTSDSFGSQHRNDRRRTFGDTGRSDKTTGKSICPLGLPSFAVRLSWIHQWGHGLAGNTRGLGAPWVADRSGAGPNPVEPGRIRYPYYESSQRLLSPHVPARRGATTVEKVESLPAQHAT